MDFALGFLASLAATACVAWFLSSLSVNARRQLDAFLADPILQVRLRFDGSYREKFELIRRLFQAWDSKDINQYMECWNDDAKRITGALRNIENRLKIRQKFERSIEEYVAIQTESVVIGGVRNNFPEPQQVMIEVRYRQILVRADDGLPLLEDSSDVYVLEDNGSGWKIKGNYDHYTPIGPAA